MGCNPLHALYLGAFLPRPPPPLPPPGGKQDRARAIEAAVMAHWRAVRDWSPSRRMIRLASPDQEQEEEKKRDLPRNVVVEAVQHLLEWGRQRDQVRGEKHRRNEEGLRPPPSSPQSPSGGSSSCPKAPCSEASQPASNSQPSSGETSEILNQESVNSSPAELDSGVSEHTNISSKEKTPSGLSNPHSQKSEITVNERFLKDYNNIECIADGGFGCVYKAHHLLDSTQYAIKKVKWAIGKEEKVTHEVEALAKLSHENIVRYYTCWTGKDIFPSEDSDSSSGEEKLHKCLFIKLELCKLTLEDWIYSEESTKNYKDDAFEKFQEILKGVAYIHEKHFIHRDLKPANIFISFQNIIKIGDFGLVTTGADDIPVKRTRKKGTKSYMAPEQVGQEYGNKVDIFPLGLIWFEMLHRFKTKSEKSKRWEDVRDGRFPPEFIKAFPTEKSIIKKLLSKEPSKRPPAAAILRMLLVHLFRSSSI
ncbi:interferon-induced, double-stranded RNA-activated protein kinase-like [Rhineura floridana]|uniref:interferon-induced, double-stranded RNA-activated protein kinase-like n=1 Tax=Rhineura floridana TaxID=261503 RepID=UPI002AC893C5|nr:interferon-induced, double-stranded RNA-activated protein kinase-like [Rhineura floridana]